MITGNNILNRNIITTAFLLCLIFSLASVKPAFAQTYQVVNVMVAYDEELVDTAIWSYWYSPEVFCRLIVEYVSLEFEAAFKIKFCIVQYISWESNNSNTDDIGELLFECINETGFHSGMTYNTIPIDILIAFSDQAIINGDYVYYGCAAPTLGAVIIIETYLFWSFGQCTDNILQHELSHLYDANDHWSNALDCVMNLYPISAGLDGFCPKMFATSNWCAECINIISENSERWGREHFVGSGPSHPILPYAKEELKVEK